MAFHRPEARRGVRGAAVVWLAVAVLTAALAAPAARAAAIEKYSVAVEGIDDGDLRKSIIDVSQLKEGEARPVPTNRALQRRVDAGIERVDKLMRARGFYDAKIDSSIETTGPASRKVVLRVTPGPAYHLSTIAIVPATPGEPRTALDIPYKTLGIAPGDVAIADDIAGADAKLLAALAHQAYPLAKIESRKVTVDHATRRVAVVITVKTGPYARFGATSATGLTSVDSSLIARHVVWKRGAPFDAAKLEKTRKALRETGLFSSVVVKHGDTLDSRGELPVTVSVVERKHRSVGVGGSFSTTEGVLGKLFWEHRNLAGHGERLQLRGEAGNIRQGAFGNFRIPDIGALGQDVVVDAHVSREQPDGYTSIETAAVGRIERRFATIYSGSAGVGFDRSSVDENVGYQDFTYLVLPLSLRRDTTDDILDPGHGGRDALSFTPNIGIMSTDSNFYSAQLFDSVYVPVLPEKKLILAGWARIGTVFGESTTGIPANKRRYAGGPGSVRGYALNSIGPLDAQKDPIGGRSSTEFGLELRWRIVGPFGMAAFTEAGGVYDDAVPDWGRDLQWGAGLGGRYFTSFGPIRLDVAVPLNRRNEVDDAFQILISLGQAF